MELRFKKGDPVPHWMLNVKCAKARFGCDGIAAARENGVHVFPSQPLSGLVMSNCDGTPDCLIEVYDVGPGAHAQGAPTYFYCKPLAVSRYPGAVIMALTFRPQDEPQEGILG